MVEARKRFDLNKKSNNMVIMASLWRWSPSHVLLNSFESVQLVAAVMSWGALIKCFYSFQKSIGYVHHHPLPLISTFDQCFPRTLASRVISSNSPNANSFLYAMRTYVFLTIGGSQVFSIQVSSIPKSSFIGFVQLYQIKIQGLFKGFFKTISNFSRTKNYQGWLGHIHCLFFTRRATPHNLEV